MPECDCRRPMTADGIYHESTCAERLTEAEVDWKARAETAEAACETSGAALVVMNDLLKEAEADRDAARILIRSHESLISQLRGDMVRFRQQRDTLTEALRDMYDYGNHVGLKRSLMEKARRALAAVKGREDA